MNGFLARGGGWVVAQFTLVPAAVAVPFLFPQLWPWPPSLVPAIRVAAILLLAAGGALALMGSLRLGRNLTPMPAPTEDGDLRTEGVYAWVRHPIYAGVLLAAVGAMLLGGSAAAVPLALAVYGFFDRKAAAEERFLVERYPQYGEYRRRVGKLLPFVGRG